MTNWKDIFVPNEHRFVEYLVNQAKLTAEGLSVLHQFMADPAKEERSELIHEMSDLEKRGDEIRKMTILDLLETFVTPIDREDIYALSRSIDDVLDYADSTIKELVIYDVAPTAQMLEMAGILHESAQHLLQAVEHMVKDPETCVSDMVRVKQAENRVEALYREANADLFDQTDVNHIFKVREVYRHLSNCADRMDESADMIGSIVIKGNV